MQVQVYVTSVFPFQTAEKLKMSKTLDDLISFKYLEVILNFGYTCTHCQNSCCALSQYKEATAPW